MIALSMKHRIRIVLVETSHPGNIGASARAMKAMGFSSLTLVNPGRFPTAEATERAAGADDILGEARVVDTLTEALSDTTFVVGTSARPRYLAVPEWAPNQATEVIMERLGSGPVAVVFGRERSGLSNNELDQCQGLIRIPSELNFSSLNLSAAVQIITYELQQRFMHWRETPIAIPKSRPTQEQLEGMYQHLQEALTELGFLHPNNPRLLMRRLRRLLNRADLELAELQIVRGILSAIQRALSPRH